MRCIGNSPPMNRFKSTRARAVDLKFLSFGRKFVRELQMACPIHRGRHDRLVMNFDLIA